MQLQKKRTNIWDQIMLNLTKLAITVSSIVIYSLTYYAIFSCICLNNKYGCQELLNWCNMKRDPMMYHLLHKIVIDHQIQKNTPDFLRNIVDTIGFRVCSSSSTCV